MRGCKRALACKAAEADPELAEWQLCTTVRYDERRRFTMTIRGRAHYAPLVRAGLDA